MPEISASEAPLRTFLLFTSLPHELQDLIFHHAVNLYPARILELLADTPATICLADNDIVRATYSFTSSAPIPPLLHTCARSREFAKKRWELAFASRMKLVMGTWTGSRWEVDMGRNWRSEDEDDDDAGDGDEAARAGYAAGLAVSAAAAMSKRELARYDKLTKLQASLEEIPRVWMDFETDALMFLEVATLRMSPVVGGGHFRSDINVAEMARVRNLVLSFEDYKESVDIFNLRVYDPDLDASSEISPGVLGSVMMENIRGDFPGATNLMFRLDDGEAYSIYVSQLHEMDDDSVSEYNTAVMSGIMNAYEEDGGRVLSAKAVTALVN